MNSPAYANYIHKINPFNKNITVTMLLKFGKINLFQIMVIKIY